MTVILLNFLPAFKYWKEAYVQNSIHCIFYNNIKSTSLYDNGDNDYDNGEP